MGNQQKNNEKKWYVPLEIKEGVVLTPEYENAPREVWRLGNRMARVILVPATEEVYKAYMRPMWREQKREERLKEKRRKREEALNTGTVYPAQGIDTLVSFDVLNDTEYGFSDSEISQTAEEQALQKIQRENIKQIIRTLDETNRQIAILLGLGYSEAAIGKKIGMSQKGVNKRRHKLKALFQSLLDKQE